MRRGAVLAAAPAGGGWPSWLRRPRRKTATAAFSGLEFYGVVVFVSFDFDFDRAGEVPPTSRMFLFFVAGGAVTLQSNVPFTREFDQISD